MGCIGLFFPQVYGDGWGWIQLAILGKLGIGIMMAIALAKIIATSFTISSGGSGGVFGPTLFIGGMIGGAVGYSAHYFYPNIVAQPEAFVVVGMASFFAGVASAPIGTLLMCSEMTRGYGLIAPLMLVSIIAILFTRQHSIYARQVQSKRESPAHTADFTVNLFAETRERLYKPEKLRRAQTTSYGQLKKIFSASRIECFPVYDENDALIGSVNWDHARTIVFEEGLEDLIIAEDMMSPVRTVTPEDNFYDAFMKFMETNAEELLAVSPDDGNIVLGVCHDDLIAAYSAELNRRKTAVSEERFFFYSMPSFSMRYFKESLVTPSRSAALVLMPLVFCSAFSIARSHPVHLSFRSIPRREWTNRSRSWRVRVRRQHQIFGQDDIEVSIATPRSMMFSSSRIFPGKGYSISSSMA